MDSHFSSCLNASSDRNKSAVPEAVDSARLPITEAVSYEDNELAIPYDFFLSGPFCCYDDM